MKEKNDELKNIFSELYNKPKNLDHNIMQKIYALETEKKALTVEKKKTNYTWFYVILAVFFVVSVIVGLAYSDVKNNGFIWGVFFSILIPLMIDFLLRRKKQID